VRTRQHREVGGAALARRDAGGDLGGDGFGFVTRRGEGAVLDDGDVAAVGDQPLVEARLRLQPLGVVVADQPMRGVEDGLPER